MLLMMMLVAVMVMVVMIMMRILLLSLLLFLLLMMMMNPAPALTASEPLVALQGQAAPSLPWQQPSKSSANVLNASRIGRYLHRARVAFKRFSSGHYDLVHHT
jgi:cell division protein YceG involved in septum cleavage